MLGVEFAPLRIPIERRLQTAIIFYFCSEFLFLGFFSTGILAYTLFYTRFYYFSLLYIAWFAYDLGVPFKGGRRSSWMRNFVGWKHFANFFPVKLVKTAELSPEKNYIFGLHPHGLLCFSHFANFATEGTGFSKLFPNIIPHLITLNYQFYLPFHREIFLLSGACSASRESIEYIISKKGKGNAAAIVVGGALEVLDTIPNKMNLTLKKRKGFVRLALKHGASLVPVISFGENDLFTTMHEEESLYNRIQEKIIKAIGFPIPAFYGRGLFQYSFGIVPFRKPITTVVGKPIDTEATPNPTQEQIDALHQSYIDAVVQLFEENKDKYGAADVVLKIK